MECQTSHTGPTNTDSIAMFGKCHLKLSDREEMGWHGQTMILV